MEDSERLTNAQSTLFPSWRSLCKSRDNAGYCKLWGLRGTRQGTDQVFAVFSPFSFAFLCGGLFHSLNKLLLDDVGFHWCVRK